MKNNMQADKRKIPDSKLPLMSPSKKDHLKALCQACEDSQKDMWPNCRNKENSTE